MSVRGIRGATTVEANEEQFILEATAELFQQLVDANGIVPEDIASIIITVTQDLDAAFPARAIRELPGWDLVPLMCALEVSVKGSLEKCIRLMVHVNTDKRQDEIRHIFLGRARTLRPDLAEKE
ncbi:monofunctional chorismate mutase, clade 1 [Thermobacillus composti KWC4]|uniref:chorismate mutase n=1 Tax=Thermobacillus composti (strain DSM 18247 / JCM 13945 / KWC4) TaxID=717605 RepID=L0EDU0_THECK|nr:chorismate mutase [Thermobacillus composti]AGA57977.1 monofunctional chorismate mutase, clade 1 [Thermobacillus composti KWC4]